MGDDVEVLRIADTLKLDLHYDSYNADNSNYRIDTVLGIGWTHSYNLFLTEYRFDAFVHRGNGRITKFQHTPDGRFITQTGYFDTLVKLDANTYVMTDKEGTQFRYEKLSPSPFLMPGPPFYIKQITDRNGLQTRFQYNADNRLEKIVDPYGRVVNFAYNADKKIQSITDPLGRTTQFQYNAKSYDLLSVKDPTGKAITFTYNANHQMAGKTDKAGNRFTFDFDANGKPVAERDGAGNKLFQLSNNKAWGINNGAVLTQAMRLYTPATTTLVDGRGNVWLNEYEQHGYITKTIAPDGSINRYVYDPLTLKQTSITDANGHSTQHQYDALGNRTQTIDALGHTTQYTYEPQFNHVTSVTDENGRLTTYTYDAKGNKIRETDALGHSKTWTYDSQGHVLTETDKNGIVSQFEYDVFGNLIKETNGAGDVTRYAYDANGNPITITHPSGNVATISYDGMNRVIKVVDLVGLVATFTYDGNGKRTSQTDGNGNTTRFEYDLRDRLVKITDGLNNTITQAYDGNDNRILITDRNGHITTLAYDGQDRLTKTTDALGNISQKQYDGVGNLLRIIDANNHETAFQYDAINRLVKETYADGGVRTYTYDPVGNKTTRTDQTGQITHYQYDALNRLTQRTYPVSPADSFTYDDENHLLTAERDGWLDTFAYDGAYRVTQAKQNGQTVNYAYDIPNRKRAVTYPSGRVITEQADLRSRLDHTDDASSTTPIVQYAYDLGNRVVSRSYRNGVVANYTQNPNNWILDINHIVGATQIAGFGYAYDNEGNKLYEQKGHAPNDSEAYQYDSIDRLTRFKVGSLVGPEIPAPSSDTRYNLDPLGNWDVKITNGITETRSHNEANELIAINGAPISYDGKGNLTEDSQYQLTYDEENRLVKVTRKSDNRVVGQYKYDALSRRVVKRANPSTAPMETRYFYDEKRIVEEQNNLGVTLATYVYGNYIDEVISMDRNNDSYYFHQNALWSVEAITDSIANVVERASYDAYGTPFITDGSGINASKNVWGTPHSAIGNPWLFTGRQLDEETGLYYYRARYYNSDKGRFISRWKDSDNDLNLYQYQYGRVTFYTDPYGDPDDTIWSRVPPSWVPTEYLYPPYTPPWWHPPFIYEPPVFTLFDTSPVDTPPSTPPWWWHPPFIYPPVTPPWWTPEETDKDKTKSRQGRIKKIRDCLMLRGGFGIP